MLKQIKCPICGHRFFDKEDGAIGIILHKCSVCKTIWSINLATIDFVKIDRNEKINIPSKGV